MKLTTTQIEEWRQRIQYSWRNGTPGASEEIDALCAMAASAVAEEVPPSASLRLLLDQVRREWYRFTGYSQLKADIDYALDGEAARSERGPT